MFFSDAILNSKVFLLVVKIFSKKIDSFWEKKVVKKRKFPGLGPCISGTRAARELKPSAL